MRWSLGWHPHSDRHGDRRGWRPGSSTPNEGKAGVLTAGSVEWMRAARRLAHGRTRAGGRDGISALGRAAARAQRSAERQSLRDARGVARRRPRSRHPGSHGKMKSPIDAPDMNYLVVSLKAGERWFLRASQRAQGGLGRGARGRAPDPDARSSGRSRSSSPPRRRSTSSPGRHGVRTRLGASAPARTRPRQLLPFTRAPKALRQAEDEIAAIARACSPKARRATPQGIRRRSREPRAPLA